MYNDIHLLHSTMSKFTETKKVAALIAKADNDRVIAALLPVMVELAGEERKEHDKGVVVLPWCLSHFEAGLIDRKQHLEAIKNIRERTGLGLAEAKKLADDYRDRPTR